MEQKPHTWNDKDKLLYALSMIPFLIAFLGSAYVLSTYSILLTVISIGIYILLNFFQAGCCIGCPYRGDYCPAFFGVYLGNYISSNIYKDRKFEESFFKRNEIAGEITLIVWVLFPLYWLFLTGWYLVPIYLGLLVIHILLFVPTQCSKCGYNTICPGGKVWQGCKKRLPNL